MTARQLSDAAVSALCFAIGILLGAWLARQWGPADALGVAAIYGLTAAVFVFRSAAKHQSTPDPCPRCGQPMIKLLYDRNRVWCDACDITARSAEASHG